MNNDIARRVRRYEEFYRSNRPGDLLIVVRQNPYWIRKRNLFEYDFENGGHLALAADMARSAEEIFAKSAAIDDDMIPWLGADFGIAIHHTYVVDAPVEYAEWTSWAPHPLEGPDGYARLAEVRYDPANRWVKRIKGMTQFWIERKDAPYMAAGHYHYAPLDLANALRGNDLFLDFYDHPEELTELLRRGTETMIAFEQDLRALRGDTPGLPFWGALAPKGAAFVSEDAMDMIGPALSEQWGRPWTEKFRDRFGGLTVHHHMMGAASHKVIGAMCRNSLVQISNDPNCPPAAEKLEQLYADSGTNALMFDCSVPELRKLRDTLKRIRAVVVTATGDNVELAREAVDIVRSISNIAA